MSNVITLLARFLAALLERDRAPLDPDTMSLHDWADLPPHHPASERAPC